MIVYFGALRFYKEKPISTIEKLLSSEDMIVMLLVNYRIRGIENEIRIINQADNYFELHDLKLHSFLRIQKRVYEKRKECLINTKLISSVMMVRYLRYYGQTRFWMTDLYYVLKNKHK